MNVEELIKSWRDYANDHYCQTYNKGMAQGLEKAADELEALLQRAHLTMRATDECQCLQEVENGITRRYVNLWCPHHGIHR